MLSRPRQGGRQDSTGDFLFPPPPGTPAGKNPPQLPHFSRTMCEAFLTWNQAPRPARANRGAGGGPRMLSGPPPSQSIPTFPGGWNHAGPHLGHVPGPCDHLNFVARRRKLRASSLSTLPFFLAAAVLRVVSHLLLKIPVLGEGEWREGRVYFSLLVHSFSTQ